jgi:gliding motility-associated-like protein
LLILLKAFRLLASLICLFLNLNTRNFQLSYMNVILSKSFRFVLIILMEVFAQQSFAQLAADAGIAQSICVGDTATIGGAPSAAGGVLPYSYSWMPSTRITNANSANPQVYPLNSTTYTLTVTDGASTVATSTVLVSVHPLPMIDAGADTLTITEGETITLQATGGTSYEWVPLQDILYPQTAKPEVSPKDTSVYLVTGTLNGCSAKDWVVINVLPDMKVVIYNTFTPNGDNKNDVFMIQHIDKYPANRLEIYNRYGRLVYEKNVYDNSWGGRSFGEKIPNGVYFYILNLGDGSEVKRGTVTMLGNDE